MKFVHIYLANCVSEHQAHTGIHSFYTGKNKWKVNKN